MTAVRLSYCLSVCFERAQITRTFNSKIRTHHRSGFKFDSARFVLEAFFIERISTQYVLTLLVLNLYRCTFITFQVFKCQCSVADRKRALWPLPKLIGDHHRPICQDKHIVEGDFLLLFSFLERGWHLHRVLLIKNFSPILLLLLPELLIAKQHPLLQGGPERCLEWRKKEENKLPVVRNGQRQIISISHFCL